MAVETLSIHTPGQGLHEITREVAEVVRQSSTECGLCTVFVQHTSASICIQENADPSAKYDLERWMNRLVAEGDTLYTHTYEGADDMPAHIKAALTTTSLGIPVIGGNLALGTWQGIYLWEHRKRSHRRKVIVHCGN